MNIELKIVVGNAASEMQFAHGGEFDLVEESRYVEVVVSDIAINIVGVEDQAAGRSVRNLIEEGGE